METKTKKEDWIVYILFWLGAIIGILISMHLKEKSFLVYLSFPLIFGSLAEAIFMIPYIIIKSFLFTNKTDSNKN